MENKKNFYIDGKWVTPRSKEEINVIDPATEEECAVISLGNKEDIDIAVKVAKNSFNKWKETSKEERIAYEYTLSPQSTDKSATR